MWFFVNVGWACVEGLFVTHVHVNKCSLCISETMHATLKMILWKEAPAICAKPSCYQGGNHSVQPSGCCKQHSLLGINSSALTTGGNWASMQWFVRFTGVFIVFLSKKFVLSVKLLIFPVTERFHGDFCCYLHVYGENCNLWVIWEISTVSAVVI